MSAVGWLDSLSPWPREFGLEGMRALLAELGDPQEAYPAIHVVGTNGKSTATVTIEQLLLSEGLAVGSTISPHVASWSERIRLNGEQVDFEEAVGRVREAAERLDSTQFEIVTAAALAAFAEAGVDVAVVEAGLGGRLDATNVLRTRVVLLTNVGLEHTDVLGETLEEIAREKLAVAPADAVVVLPDETYARLVPGREIVIGGARDAAEAFVGHPIDGAIPRSRSRAGSSAGRVRSGTVRTIPTVSSTSSTACPPATTPSSSRSWPTRTPTRCSVGSRARARGSWRRGRRPSGRFRPSTSRASRAVTSPTSRRRGPGACRGARARARGAGPRDRVALPARRPRRRGAAMRHGAA